MVSCQNGSWLWLLGTQLGKQPDLAQPEATGRCHRETSPSSFSGCSQVVAVAKGDAEMQRAMAAGPGRGSAAQWTLRWRAPERVHFVTPVLWNWLTQHWAGLPIVSQAVIWASASTYLLSSCPDFQGTFWALGSRDIVSPFSGSFVFFLRWKAEGWAQTRTLG